MTTPLAEKIVDVARNALPVPGADIARRLLTADLELLDDIDAQIAVAEVEIDALLPSTPFAVLRTVPGWGPQRVAAYGAAVGDPDRWPSPKQLYRAAGLTPRIYESAGRRRDGHITREGAVPHRVALVELGVGLWHQEPAARAHGAAMRARGKPGAVIAIALAHRANRIAFAMVRDQQPWDGGRWAA
jgi:transposase